MVAGAEHYDEEDLLAQCPWCAYSLEGLPVEHACPGCGRAFDRRWVVFGTGEVSWLTRVSRIVWFAALAVLVVAALLAIVHTAHRWRFGMAQAMLFLSVFPVAWVVRRVSTALRDGPLVIIGPTGVAVYRGTAEQHRLQWKEVGRAEYVFSTGSIEFGVAEKRVVISSSEVVKWDVAGVPVLLQAINESPWRTNGANDESTGAPPDSD